MSTSVFVFPDLLPDVLHSLVWGYFILPERSSLFLKFGHVKQSCFDLVEKSMITLREWKHWFVAYLDNLVVKHKSQLIRKRWVSFWPRIIQWCLRHCLVSRYFKFHIETFSSWLDRNQMGQTIEKNWSPTLNTACISAFVSGRDFAWLMQNITLQLRYEWIPKENEKMFSNLWQRAVTTQNYDLLQQMCESQTLGSRKILYRRLSQALYPRCSDCTLLRILNSYVMPSINIVATRLTFRDLATKKNFFTMVKRHGHISHITLAHRENEKIL